MQWGVTLSFWENRILLGITGTPRVPRTPTHAIQHCTHCFGGEEFHFLLLWLLLWVERGLQSLCVYGWQYLTVGVAFRPSDLPLHCEDGAAWSKGPTEVSWKNFTSRSVLLSLSPDYTPPSMLAVPLGLSLSLAWNWNVFFNRVWIVKTVGPLGFWRDGKHRESNLSFRPLFHWETPTNLLQLC